jgi:glycosyltransferase involved in cell wall biosynthesis
MPLVTFIIPVKNASKTLISALDSCLNQTLKDFDIYLVDDGSDDRSDEIIDYYVNGYSNIYSLLSNSNGIAESLNVMIRRANSRYIARMDADDICMDKRLEFQLEYMEEHKLDICGSWVAAFNNKSAVVMKKPICHLDISKSLVFDTPFWHPTVIFDMDKLGHLEYSNVYPQAEDYALWVDQFYRGARMGNCPIPLLQYRLHSMQVSQLKESSQLHQTAKIRMYILSNDSRYSALEANLKHQIADLYLGGNCGSVQDLVSILTFFSEHKFEPTQTVWLRFIWTFCYKKSLLELVWAFRSFSCVKLPIAGLAIWLLIIYKLLSFLKFPLSKQFILLWLYRIFAR